ncbi:MAG TPA: TldD/PmbA family protein [Sandaracinaceae bacterium LLY-WYZ-13_1]|nr:TldD/PmbA family protein [Sandaracinaceae bacterium LLY-WYZ-13_1]
MLRELAQRAGDAVEMARAAGAGDAWASASRSTGTEVQVRDGEVEKIQRSTSRGLSVRLYVDGRYATYRTSDLRPEVMRGFIRDAVAMTRALERDPHRVIPDPRLFEGRSTADLELVDPTILRVAPDTRVGWCMEMSERCRRHERLVSATVGANDGHSMVASASSNGFSGHHERTSHWRGGNVTLREEGDARPAGSWWTGARHLEDVPAAAEVGDEALRQAVRRLGAQQGPTGRRTMVVEPRAAGRLIGLLLGPAHARSFSQERSFWRGRVGEAVLGERLRITDEPLLVRGLGSRYYDGEGIAARPRTLVADGALQTLFVDTYYGRKTGMEPTTGGSSNLVVAPGERGRAAITADVDDGILVTSWLGGNSDSTTGDFSLGLRGHRIEGGRVGAAVQEMNVTGNLLELFAGLAEVGDDPWPYSSRRVPTLAFEGVQFSGA